MSGSKAGLHRPVIEKAAHVQYTDNGRGAEQAALATKVARYPPKSNSSPPPATPSVIANCTTATMSLPPRLRIVWKRAAEPGLPSDR
ncbi:MAG: hypothetical protein ACRYF2_09180 [Janthinobacterium lividum]